MKEKNTYKSVEKRRKSSVQRVNMLLLITLVIVFLSGVLLHPLQDMLVMLLLHKISAILFVLLMIVHILQHR